MVKLAMDSVAAPEATRALLAEGLAGVEGLGWLLEGLMSAGLAVKWLLAKGLEDEWLAVGGSPDKAFAEAVVEGSVVEGLVGGSHSPACQMCYTVRFVMIGTLLPVGRDRCIRSVASLHPQSNSNTYMHTQDCINIAPHTNTHIHTEPLTRSL